MYLYLTNSPGGYYAYCNNNPIRAMDNTGYMPQILIAAAIGGAIGAGIETESQLIENGRLLTAQSFKKIAQYTAQKQAVYTEA